ncbi:MAG TPA: Do family serine endopeptidase [Caulobacteraceae bacterium]|nr:Do family serine endopeptidase [Caulobacteraceae bacterium]
MIARTLHPMRARPLALLFIGLLAACSAPPSQSTAQPLQGGLALPEPRSEAPSSAAQVKLSFAPVVRRAAPAVVNISSKRVVRQQVDPFWQMFGAVPGEQVEGSLGSGVIVRADGVIVTNNHVIEGGQEITVSLSDRREYPAKVLLADPRADLAVLKIDATSLPTLAINAGQSLQVGDLVLAIGDPFGVGQTVTNGIISALNRTEVGSGDAFSYIQTDAAINPGNSGGALVDMDGQLIGINSFIMSRSGGSVGVGFAIPGPVVRQVVEAALGGHAVVRPWLGVSGQTVTSDIAHSLGMDRPEGVLVDEVYPGSSAARAGLEQGDVILSIDGEAVDDVTGLNYRIGAHQAGDAVTLTYRRKAERRTAHITATAAPADPPRDETTLTGREPFQGAVVVNLSPAVAIDLGVSPFAKGVLITGLKDGIAAQYFRPGDIIRQVNDAKIGTVAELKAALAAGRRWRVAIERGGQTVTGDFGL